MSLCSAPCIRVMQERDIESLVRDFTAPWSTQEVVRKQWNHNLDEQERQLRIVAVVELQGRIVGYGSLLVCPYLCLSRNPHSFGVPEISAVWIHHDFRRKGFAKALLLYLEEIARQAGYKEIGIGVGLYADYGPAQKLYNGLGYIPDGHGITSHGKSVVPGQSYPVDDDLILWLKKVL